MNRYINIVAITNAQSFTQECRFDSDPDERYAGFMSECLDSL